MQDRETKFAALMDNVYTLTRLMSKYNLPRCYGTEDELYLNEVHTIKFIGQYPGISLSELGERTYRTKGATSMMVNQLEKKGLVQKRCADSDCRRYELRLTEKGQQVDAFHVIYDKVRHQKMLALLEAHEEEDFDRSNEILRGVIRYFLE